MNKRSVLVGLICFFFALDGFVVGYSVRTLLMLDYINHRYQALRAQSSTIYEATSLPDPRLFKLDGGVGFIAVDTSSRPHLWTAKHVIDDRTSAENYLARDFFTNQPLLLSNLSCEPWQDDGLCRLDLQTVENTNLYLLRFAEVEYDQVAVWNLELNTWMIFDVVARQGDLVLTVGQTIRMGVTVVVSYSCQGFSGSPVVAARNGVPLRGGPNYIQFLVVGVLVQAVEVTGIRDGSDSPENEGRLCGPEMSYLSSIR